MIAVDRADGRWTSMHKKSQIGSDPIMGVEEGEQQAIMPGWLETN